MRVLPIYDHQTSWEHLENVYSKIAQSLWCAEDKAALDQLLIEIQDYGLTSSEALSFIWCAGNTSDAFHAPSDAMMEWICDRYLSHFEGRMTDWVMLSRKLHTAREGVLPKNWACVLSTIISDKNTSGILDLPKQWVVEWSRSGLIHLDYCHAEFILPALRTWPYPDAQNLLASLISGSQSRTSFYRGLLPEGIGSMQLHYYQDICKKYWPSDNNRWIALETLNAGLDIWLTHLLSPPTCLIEVPPDDLSI